MEQGREASQETDGRVLVRDDEGLSKLCKWEGWDNKHEML